jgi:hypothetical protein
MESTVSELRWKALYRLAAVCVFLAFAVMVLEILISAIPVGPRLSAETPTTAYWFRLFRQSPFMAMRNLGLINIIATTLMIPVFASLCGLHRRENGAFAGLTLLFFLAGYAVFMADNTAFPMLALSKLYAAAESESQRSLLAAAGEALLVRGRSHTPGTFPGFFLSDLAGISVSLVMLRGKVFNKATGVIGIVTFGFLFIFEVISSFLPSLFVIATIIVMLGGISALVWYMMIGLRLVRV